MPAPDQRRTADLTLTTGLREVSVASLQEGIWGADLVDTSGLPSTPPKSLSGSLEAPPFTRKGCRRRKNLKFDRIS